MRRRRSWQWLKVVLAATRQIKTKRERLLFFSSSLFVFFLLSSLVSFLLFYSLFVFLVPLCLFRPHLSYFFLFFVVCFVLFLLLFCSFLSSPPPPGKGVFIKGRGESYLTLV